MALQITLEVVCKRFSGYRQQVKIYATVLVWRAYKPLFGRIFYSHQFSVRREVVAVYLSEVQELVSSYYSRFRQAVRILQV